jgi:catechol 2,3-dioxygenase-like lactoylglutathione lyase family enzyme
VSARLQHVAVTFPPGEGARVRGFYGGVLGLDEMAVPAEVAHLGWIWFATGEPGVELHFVPHEIAPDPERMHHFCLEVDDLAGARGRVEAAGGTVTEPRARIQGRDRLFTRDPLGNLVELVAPLPG